jgi:hypothetical protein
MTIQSRLSWFIFAFALFIVVLSTEAHADTPKYQTLWRLDLSYYDDTSMLITDLSVDRPRLMVPGWACLQNKTTVKNRMLSTSVFCSRGDAVVMFAAVCPVDRVGRNVDQGAVATDGDSTSYTRISIVCETRPK